MLVPSCERESHNKKAEREFMEKEVLVQHYCFLRSVGVINLCCPPLLLDLLLTYCLKVPIRKYYCTRGLITFCVLLLSILVLEPVGSVDDSNTNKTSKE